MKKRTNFTNLIVIAILTWPCAMQATQELEKNQQLKPEPFNDKNDTSQQSPHEKPYSEPLIYIPPASAKPAPKIRVVQGGTRSAKLLQPIQLTLMTPEHIAHTTNSQPMLYWYLSKNTDLPAVFTLAEFDAIEPLIEKRLPAPLTSGFHSIHLSQFGVELAVGKTYEWSISILQDKVHELPSSEDTIAKSFIKRVQEKANTTTDIVQSDFMTRAKAYAKQGLWYDSLESLMETASTGADGQSVLDARSNLFEQVGLRDFE